MSEGLRSRPLFYEVLRRVYRSFRPTPAWRIEKALQGLPSVFFVQVGANDGVRGDPLHHLIRRNPHWRGLFIEPVNFAYQRLVRNYPEEDRFLFVNVAVAETDGNKPFYYVAETAAAVIPDLPFWFDQLGSFDRGHIVKHLGARIEPYIIRQHVPCRPLADILSRHNVRQIDLLHIDTEGYDWQVLRQLDFARYRPRVILLERLHLSPVEKESSIALLREQGYALFTLEADWLAIARQT